MDRQRRQAVIRILLTLDIQREPRQALRFTPVLHIRRLVIRRLVIRRLGIHKLGIHKLGIHKLGIRWLGIHKLGIHRLGIHRLGIRRLGIHKLGIRWLVIRKLGILVTLDILVTPGIHLMAMLLGMPSKEPCSPRPYFRPMVVRHRWQVVGIHTRVIPPVPFHLLLRAIAMAHLVMGRLLMGRLPMGLLGLQVLLWVFRRMLRTSWAGTHSRLEPAATKNLSPQH